MPVIALQAGAQVSWINVDSLYQPLPKDFHIYRTTSLLDGKPNIAFYAEADLDAGHLLFFADTTFQRRLTPSGFYQKNERPLLVVNTSFFSFSTHQNLNIIMRDGKFLAYNQHSIAGRGKDTFTYRHALTGAFGISKKRKADIAWVLTDTAVSMPYAIQEPVRPFRDSLNDLDLDVAKKKFKTGLEPWIMNTAVGGGPVLVQNGRVSISNNEEIKFAGKAIDDRHPRTAIGYTAKGKLIIMVVQGRLPGISEGASLTSLAEMLRDLGCIEALNLDGGGSSCMLVNGRETIRVSDASGQRPVPGVFVIGLRK